MENCYCFFHPHHQRSNAQQQHTHHQLNGSIEDARAALSTVGEDCQSLFAIFNRNLRRDGIIISSDRLPYLRLERALVSDSLQHLATI